MNFEDTDSEEDEVVAILIETGALTGWTPRKCSAGGSRLGKASNASRLFDQAFCRIEADYLSGSSKYDARLFERRFRMHRTVFERMRSSLEAGGIFQRRRDAIGRAGIHSLQCIVAAIRKLAYGVSADSVDEYVQLSETSTISSLKAFCREVLNIFGMEYLRQPKRSGSAPCTWDKRRTGGSGLYWQYRLPTMEMKELSVGLGGSVYWKV